MANTSDPNWCKDYHGHHRLPGVETTRHFVATVHVVHDGVVLHQHVDFVYYCAAPDRSLDPADDWARFTAAELAADGDRFEPDVAEIGQRAIERVATVS